jgi:hypothetical protein
MTDDTEAIRAVEGYLAFRRTVIPEALGFDAIHDIDGGSRGHFILRESDVRGLLAENARLSALIDAVKAALMLPLDVGQALDNPAGRALWKARCRDMALAALSAPDPKENPDA